MFSLKYKNLIKETLLFEELSREDIINDREAITSFLTNIKYFPFRITNDKIFVDENKDYLKIYVLTNVGYPHKYSGETIDTNDIDIWDDDFIKNKNYMYNFYNFVIFTFENDSNILSFNKEKLRYRLIYNENQEKKLFDLPKFKKLYNKIIDKSEIQKYATTYIEKVVDEINKYIPDIKIKNSNLDEVEKEKTGKIDAKEIVDTVDGPDIKIWNKNDYSELNDTTSRIANEGTTDFMYSKPSKNNKKSKEKEPSKKLRLTPTNLIGDGEYRNINNLKTKVQQTLMDFIKKTDNKEEKLASEVLFQEIESVSQGNGNKDIDLKLFNISTDNINLHDTVLYLSKDPNEIISPIAVLKMDNIKWSSDENGISAKDEIQKIFGDKTAFENGLIAFPNTSNAPLIDSYAMITFNNQSKQLGISTKGGLNGKGANASLSSLFRFLIADDSGYKMNKFSYNKNFTKGILDECKSNGNIQDYLETNIVPKLTRVGNEYWETNKDLLTLLLLFGGNPLKYHQTIINYAVANGIGELKFNSTDIKEFAAEASSQGLTDLVMDLLDKQKYKFCQINTVPTLTKDKFDYKISVQYPAKFSGTVTFVKAANENGLRFHISGD